MLPDDFAVMILTHGRADRQFTLRTLEKQGYTGKWFLVCDDEDKTLPDYIERYGDRVLTFSKAEEAKRTDVGDNLPERNMVVFARNAVFDLAEQQGIKWFLVLDDDYHRFNYKFNEKRQYGTWLIRSLDAVWAEMLAYFKATPITTLCMSQAGDHIGGYNASDKKSINTKRKSMNTFFCSTDRRFTFMGRINEDVNAYVEGGRRGEIHLTLMGLELLQTPTQTNAGGLTDIYLEQGTYVKSFYSVMYAPSCVVVKNIVTGFNRIHHKVDWDHAVPKIVRQDVKKGARKPAPSIA